MKLYPNNALEQIEFNKIQNLLAANCTTEPAKNKAQQLRIHTALPFIKEQINQTKEYKQVIENGRHLPNNFATSVQQELTLLPISGATLSAQQMLLLKKLAQNTEDVFRWFTPEMQTAFPTLYKVIAQTHYDKNIKEIIEQVLDDFGTVKDNASPALADIRMQLYRKRNEQRRIFDKVLAKYAKAGYLADTGESFMNGRRVLAVLAEYKRSVKGILHGESDSGKTTFIEPEDTIDVNNDIVSLELSEQKEIKRILKALTQNLQPYQPLLQSWYNINTGLDFIRAKAMLAISMNASAPQLTDKPVVNFVNAYHPLLYLYNKKLNKPTVPVSLQLKGDPSILVISGPNAGGKTVAMKTVGLNQLMAQAGLLVPMSADSTVGIFKQFFIQIGDTQSIEYELSTYAAHLQSMKHFVENANGKTLFFIDELGGGSDPNLGGAFAEAIMESLAHKHAVGIITTHYLNLKLMAQNVGEIVNGSMLFDEKNLQPSFKLQVGKPGSSYTFAIAERIGMPQNLISRAKNLAEKNQYQLDKLLNKTEQDLQLISSEKTKLEQLITDNKKLQTKLHSKIEQEQHQKELARLKEQNKFNQEKLQELRETDRKIKAAIQVWRRAEDKDAAIKDVHKLLTQQKDKFVKEKQSKLLKEKYTELASAVQVGVQAKMKQSRQVGTVKEIKGKKAVLQIGSIPITVALENLVVVEEK